MKQNPSQEDDVVRIKIEYSDSTLFRKDGEPNVIQMGNVIIRHDSTFIFCDSAYMYDASNTIEAFGVVRIKQGDTLFIYGSYLKYDGNLNLAQMRENVRMVHNDEVTLFTDHLDYDRNLNIGYYFDGGLIVDSINELKSVYGQYSPDTKIAFFKDDVQLNNPNFVLTSDILKYNTETKIADILGAAVIVSDSGTIYSDRGWYNTEKEKAMLFNRSIVVSKDETKTITADSMYYPKSDGYLEAYGDMILNDTLRNVIIRGDYGFYNEFTDYAFATDRAQMIEYSQKDSLFIHADTLKMLTIGEEREVKAYYGVRFFREDIQGVCDSLHFSTADSLLYFYKNPILWHGNYQITGDTIKVIFNDSTIEKMEFLDFAFAVERIDTTYFNQLKGRNMYAHFVAGELIRLDAVGAAEAIFYPFDNDGVSFISRAKMTSDSMKFFFENRELAVIIPYVNVAGEKLPIPDLNPENKFLSGFTDFDYLRPKNKGDIFSTIEMKKEDIPAPRRRKGQHLETNISDPKQMEVQEQIHNHDH